MKIRNPFARRTASVSGADNPVSATVTTPTTPIEVTPAAVPFVTGESQKITLGSDAVWDTEAHPHLLIAGPQDSGKTTLQRRVIDHCIQHKDDWLVYGMDLYRTQFVPYFDYGAPVEHVARTVSESILDLRSIQDEIRSRLIRMEKHGYKSYRELSGRLPAIMVVIDESYHVLPAIMTPAERAAMDKFDVRVEALGILKELSSYGSRAGIHISMATRVPEQGITDDLRKNMSCRVVTGVLPGESSKLMLGNESVSALMAGQGYIQFGKQGKTFTVLNPSE